MNSNVPDISEFIQQVSRKIAVRGHSYFQTGSVHHLSQTSDGKWVAHVSGTTEYTVEITLSDFRVAGYYCTCPYDYGPVCKHVVAVLYALQDRGSSDKGESETQAPQSIDERFHDRLEHLSPEKLRAFLRDYAGYHPEMRDEFMAKYGMSASTSLDTWRDYVELIRDTIRNGSDEYGFIDYSTRFRVMKPIHTLIESAREKFESEDEWGAYHINRAVVQEMPDIIQRMDDSSGDAGFILDQALENLLTLSLSTSNSDLQETIFQFVTEEFPKQKYSAFGFENRLMAVAKGLLETPEQEREIEDAINQRLEKVRREKKEPGYQYSLQHALEQKIDFLKYVDRDEEVEHIIDEHLQIDQFREQRIREAIDSKDFERAISLVEDGIKQAKQSDKPPYYQHRWDKWFFEIAKAAKDTKSIRRHAKKLFLQGRYDFSYYRQLKSTYSGEEWPEIRDEIVRALREQQPARIQTLAQIYIHENQPENLLNLLRKNPRISHLETYGKHLKDEYPDELLVIYENALRAFAKTNMGRNSYQELARLLNKIQSIPGGPDCVQNLLDEFRETYKRRPAMMEELNRVRIR